MTIQWDTGKWRNCFHYNPKGYDEPNVNRKMSKIAIAERRYDVLWGVVNPGNALCVGVFRTKREAEKYRKENAYFYVSVKVVVTPLYTNTQE